MTERDFHGAEPPETTPKRKKKKKKDESSLFDFFLFLHKEGNRTQQKTLQEAT